MRFRLLHVRPHIWFYKQNDHSAIAGQADNEQLAATCDDDDDQQAIKTEVSEGIRQHQSVVRGNLNPNPNPNCISKPYLAVKPSNLHKNQHHTQALSTRVVRKGKEVRECMVVDAGCTCRATLSTSQSKAAAMAARKLRTSNAALPRPHAINDPQTQAGSKRDHAKWHQKLTVSMNSAPHAGLGMATKSNVVSRLVCKSADDVVDIATTTTTTTTNKVFEESAMAPRHGVVGESCSAGGAEEDENAVDVADVAMPLELRSRSTVEEENRMAMDVTRQKSIRHIGEEEDESPGSSSSNSNLNASTIASSSRNSSSSSTALYTPAGSSINSSFSVYTPAGTERSVSSNGAIASEMSWDSNNTGSPAMATTAAEKLHEKVISLAELRDSIKQMKLNAKAQQLPSCESFSNHAMASHGHSHSHSHGHGHVHLLQDTAPECVEHADMGASTNNNTSELGAVLPNGHGHICSSNARWRRSPLYGLDRHRIDYPEDEEVMDMDSAQANAVETKQGNSSGLSEIDDDLDEDEVAHMWASTTSCEIQILSDYDGYEGEHMEGGESPSASPSPPPSSSSSSASFSSASTSSSSRSLVGEEMMMSGPAGNDRMHGNMMMNSCGHGAMNRKGTSTSSNGGGGGAVAMVKSSYDPHHDFKESMVEMVVAKGLRGRRPLQQLLQCYLSLNPEEYHPTIVKVFHELCSELFHDHYEH